MLLLRCDIAFGGTPCICSLRFCFVFGFSLLTLVVLVSFPLLFHRLYFASSVQLGIFLFTPIPFATFFPRSPCHATPRTLRVLRPFLFLPLLFLSFHHHHLFQRLQQTPEFIITVDTSIRLYWTPCCIPTPDLTSGLASVCSWLVPLCVVYRYNRSATRRIGPDNSVLSPEPLRCASCGTIHILELERFPTRRRHRLSIISRLDTSY